MRAKPLTLSLLLLKRRHRWLLAMALLVFTLPGWTMQVSALLDRATVGEGEAVTLIIRADGLVTGVQPDLTPLRRDFDVLGTGSSSQVRIINGQRSDSLQWRVTLMPRQSGVLTVPSLAVGDGRTEALTLTVANTPPMPEATREVWVEMEVAGDQAPYVQAQVPLTVRVYTARPIREGTLSEPQADSALIEKLGPDRRRTETRDGNVYHVIERRYAVFPQQSGALTLPPVVFRGTLAPPPPPRDSGNRQSPMQRFFDHDPLFDDDLVQRFFDEGFFGRDPVGRGRPAAAPGPALTLNVKPAPEDAGGRPWRPAEALTIADSWQDEPPRLRVGEPASRTVTLTVRGLTGAQIADIESPTVEGLRQYAEPAKIESRTDGERVIGTHAQTFTFIPERAGTLQLPPLRVDWWDTAAQRMRVAETPGWTLVVEPGAGPGPAVSPSSTLAETEIAASPAPDPMAVAVASEAGWAGERYYWLLAILAFAAGLGWLIHRRRAWVSTSARRPEPVATAHRQHLQASFLEACADNDARQAARRLLDWARAEWPEQNVTSLTAIAARLGAGAAAVLELHRHLYQHDGVSDWRGDALAQALAQGLETRAQRPSESTRADDLAPLYPG
ncbi:MAG: BatD family protein [Thiotrichales bacterium]